MHDQGTRISVLLDVHAPTVFIPQNPESSNVIVVKLGYLRVKNSFEESDVGQGVIQRWDHLFLSLEAVQIMRQDWWDDDDDDVQNYDGDGDGINGDDDGGGDNDQNWYWY